LIIIQQFIYLYEWHILSRDKVPTRRRMRGSRTSHTTVPVCNSVFVTLNQPNWSPPTCRYNDTFSFYYTPLARTQYAHRNTYKTEELTRDVYYHFVLLFWLDCGPVALLNNHTARLYILYIYNTCVCAFVIASVRLHRNMWYCNLVKW